jgi:hypothetical protein
MKINYRKVLFLLVVYFIYTYIFKGYISYTPTIPVYPNSKKEIEKVKQKINERTQKDVDFFYLTNESISAAFLPYVNENKVELERELTKHNNIILFLKYTINRPRPEQVDKTIKPLNKKTAMTPAYPAGHGYQAYLLYKYLRKKYPNKEKKLKEIALQCDDCRVKAGLHFPSDGEFSRKIIDLLVS